MYNLLTEEEIKMFLENQGLIYHVVNNMGYNQCMPEYDDFISIGKIGLIKAIQNFNPTRNIKFATFATPCITNELFMYFRRNNKHNGVISLEEPTADKLCLGDLIEDERSYFVEDMEDSEEYAKVLYYILNYLPTMTKCCMLYQLAENKQHEIAKKLNISQSYISRMITKTIKKLKTVIENNYEVKEEFSVKETGKKYTVVFSSKNVKNFKALFLKLLGDFSEKIPNFKWSSNSERSTVQMTISEQAYVFLAEFILEMDEFEITLVSKTERDVSEKPAESKKEKITLSEPSKEEEETGEDEEEIYDNSSTLPKLEEVPAVVQETTDYCNDSGYGVNEDSNGIPEKETEISEKKEGRRSRTKTGKSEAIRNYVLNLKSETFKMADILKEFPNETRGLVANVLHNMKMKRMIESMDRGIYKVIKNN